MRTVKILRSDLLGRLRVNREAHRAIFLDAVEGYRREAIRVLEEMLADAKAKRKIRRQIELVEPMDQTADYDRAIKMMEMSVNDVIELSERDFATYVLDDWDWKDQFISSSSSYSSGSSRSSR